jgi:YD repeat-containing protein
MDLPSAKPRKCRCSIQQSGDRYRKGARNESFTYDAAGNMLSYSAPFADYRFSYDARNRQTEAYVGAIGTSFLINGLGQRVAQINVRVPEFFFVYDEAGHLTGKYDSGGNSL